MKLEDLALLFRLFFNFDTMVAIVDIIFPRASAMNKTPHTKTPLEVLKSVLEGTSSSHPAVWKKSFAEYAIASIAITNCKPCIAKFEELVILCRCRGWKGSKRVLKSKFLPKRAGYSISR